jgi:hypothetical protein
MSHVYIVSTTSDGNVISLRCGICGWGENVPAEQVEFSTRPDGSKDFRFLKAQCGNCHSVSTWPISGGALGLEDTPKALAILQQAFAYRFNHDPDHPADTPIEGKAAVEEMVRAMGGQDGQKYALGNWRP